MPRCERLKHLVKIAQRFQRWKKRVRQRPGGTCFCMSHISDVQKHIPPKNFAALDSGCLTPYERMLPCPLPIALYVRFFRYFLVESHC